MSENKTRHTRNPARASGRTGQRKNDNIQYVRRVPEVSGTAYTEGMSEAYWRGMQDGESTAARMVRRADPRNVRVRSLAVISDEAEECAIAVNQAQSDGSQLAVQPQQTAAVAVLTPESVGELTLPKEEKSGGVMPVIHNAAPPERVSKTAETGIIGLKAYETIDENETDIMNMNETKRTDQNQQSYGPAMNITTAEATPEVTYALRRDQINGARVQTEQKPAEESRTKQQWSEAGNAKEGFKDILSGKKAKKQTVSSAKDRGTSFVQPWKEISLLRKVIIVLSVVLFLYALSPLVLGIFNIGIVPLVLIAWFFFTVSLLWDHIEGCQSRVINALFTAVAGIVVLGIIGMAFISGKMIGASMRTLPEDRTEVTVVVLGCLVIDDQPSLMLERRLETAADYLLSNPQAHCVVTGGQGENEDYPEAVVMKNYLLEAGVSEERIIVEQNSTSTIENIEFAAELIDKYNCHEDVVIVSDRFHQYRASLAAKDAGLNSYAMPCETAWYLVAHYWFREMAGIAQIWLQG